MLILAAALWTFSLDQDALTDSQSATVMVEQNNQALVFTCKPNSGMVDVVGMSDSYIGGAPIIRFGKIRADANPVMHPSVIVSSGEGRYAFVENDVYARELLSAKQRGVFHIGSSRYGKDKTMTFDFTTGSVARAKFKKQCDAWIPRK